MSHPHIALVGAGYTLELVARKLIPGEFVVTVRSAESVERFRDQGINAEQLTIGDRDQVEDFFSRFKNIQILVDGVPPLANEEDALVGVRSILQSYSRSSLRKIIYLSTTGVYGVSDGSVVDESRCENPQTERGKRRWEVEKLYQMCGIASCAFRIAAIYGPRRGIGQALQSGRYPYIEDGARWSNRIHVEDLSEAIVRAIRFEQALPPAINLADDFPSLTRDIVTFYCQEFGLTFPPSISFDEARAKGMESLLSNQRISNALLKKTLGLNLRYPSYREGARSEF